MVDQLKNLHAGYYILEGQTNVALRTQVGDSVRLGHQRDEVMLFMSTAESVNMSL